MNVRAKKHLGQHFLTDESIAVRIADSLSMEGYENVLEIGPGMGILTKYLLKKDKNIWVVEIDKESIDYLKGHYLTLIRQNHQCRLFKDGSEDVFQRCSFGDHRKFSL